MKMQGKHNFFLEKCPSFITKQDKGNILSTGSSFYVN